MYSNISSGEYNSAQQQFPNSMHFAAQTFYHPPQQYIETTGSGLSPTPDVGQQERQLFGVSTNVQKRKKPNINETNKTKKDQTFHDFQKEEWTAPIRECLIAVFVPPKYFKNCTIDFMTNSVKNENNDITFLLNVLDDIIQPNFEPFPDCPEQLAETLESKEALKHKIIENANRASHLGTRSDFEMENLEDHLVRANNVLNLLRCIFYETSDLCRRKLPNDDTGERLFHEHKKKAKRFYLQAFLVCAIYELIQDFEGVITFLNSLTTNSREPKCRVRSVKNTAYTTFLILRVHRLVSKVFGLPEENVLYAFDKEMKLDDHQKFENGFVCDNCARTFTAYLILYKYLTDGCTSYQGRHFTQNKLKEQNFQTQNFAVYQRNFTSFKTYGNIPLVEVGHDYSLKQTFYGFSLVVDKFKLSSRISTKCGKIGKTKGLVNPRAFLKRKNNENVDISVPIIHEIVEKREKVMNMKKDVAKNFSNLNHLVNIEVATNIQRFLVTATQLGEIKKLCNERSKKIGSEGDITKDEKKIATIIAMILSKSMDIPEPNYTDMNDVEDHVQKLFRIFIELGNDLLQKINATRLIQLNSNASTKIPKETTAAEVSILGNSIGRNHPNLSLDSSITEVNHFMTHFSSILDGTDMETGGLNDNYLQYRERNKQK